MTTDRTTRQPRGARWPGISALRPTGAGNLVNVEFTLYKDMGCTVTPQ